MKDLAPKVRRLRFFLKKNPRRQQSKPAIVPAGGLRYFYGRGQWDRVEKGRSAFEGVRFRMRQQVVEALPQQAPSTTAGCNRGPEKLWTLGMDAKTARGRHLDETGDLCRSPRPRGRFSGFPL